MTLLCEVKPYPFLIGETIRQINTYRAHMLSNTVYAVVTDKCSQHVMEELADERISVIIPEEPLVLE